MEVKAGGKHVDITLPLLRPYVTLGGRDLRDCSHQGV